MPDKPLVSIAIPTFNRAALLSHAIESAVLQSYRPVEVLISDNCSSDDTWVICDRSSDSPSVRVWRQSRNLGPVANWNFLLSMAQGELFLLLSDDDELEPSAVEKLAASLLTDPTILLCHGRSRIVDRIGNEIGQTPDTPAVEPGSSLVRAFLRGRRVLYPCATLFRTAVLRNVGGFDRERFSVAADVGAWMSVALTGAGRVACVPDLVACYRINPGLSTTTDLSTEATASLALRRLAASRLGRRYRRADGAFFTARYIASLASQCAEQSRSPLLTFCRLFARNLRWLRSRRAPMLFVAFAIRSKYPRLFYVLKRQLGFG